ncbi:similar to Saccharomyces cerevisiae YGL166W CUP2 Copper-binding transcription factor [Maudiozyma saulgeensis]|uniref:Similar to Saccharomyces cerevisiae YGL166W CUP2 Copper-binding transcription factor n=1 Tax=Maudiozyma saulgeensis TaxID=1789683 RepID=A0A1X7R0B9_9SACH|nr:similar to Saccharomyces cerevisiae YGL166W CUP2 Copper-binding transcription factor [Kazachstania saulgeensis]
MVLINGIKYACERCIRGHRVTTCNHTDQPLMMIKPKGRPSTTCSYCKELRKSKGIKPPGTCTCGRQEKKRLAQKAKEEARAKAKEFASKNCTCNNKINTIIDSNNNNELLSKENIMQKCPVHSKKNKRSTSTKRKTNNNGSTTSSTNHHTHNKPRAGIFPRVNSSTSLDSNLLSASSILSDSSNHLSTSFIDSDILTGKITKDYHHVPSLASISSLQSSNSLDQNISTPQSPPLGAMQFNFISGGFTNNNNNHNNNASSLHNVSRNWDNSNGKSHSNNNSNRSSSQINLNMLASSSNNSHINMAKSYQSSFHIGSPPVSNANKSALASPPLKPNPGAVIVPLEEFVPPDLNGVGRVTDCNSYANDWSLNGGESASFKEYVSQPDSRKSSIVPSVTSNDADDYSIHQYGKALPDRQHQASNGLLDMFLDSSSISTLSKANILLQDKHSGNHNEKGKLYTESFYPNERTRSQRTAGDNDSVRSVEVLSITPSFMDIPGNYMNAKRKTRPNRDGNNSVASLSTQNKPRSSSMDRNHRYIKNLVDSASNPVVGDASAIYDGFDANSNTNINRFPIMNSMIIDDNNNNNNNNNDMFNQSNNNNNQINCNINNINGNATDNIDNVNPNDVDMNNLYSSEASPVNTLQLSSPPSQLLSEQGFADLDNFLSTL